MKKKMLAVFICLVMVAGLIPTVAFAAENEVDVWDGTSDTSWYNETDTEFHIKTAEELAGLAEVDRQKLCSLTEVFIQTEM